MAQTEVNAQSDTLPFAGLVQSAEPGSPRSYTSEESSAEIPFGVFVGLGTNEDDGCVLPADSSVPGGVVCHSHHYAKTGELGTTGLKPGVTMGVLRKGTIWVVPEDAVDPGDAVRIRTTAGVGEQLGAFRTAADSTDTAVLSGAFWLTSAGAGEPALLEIDMTGATLTADV